MEMMNFKFAQNLMCFKNIVMRIYNIVLHGAEMEIIRILNTFMRRSTVFCQISQWYQTKLKLQMPIFIREVISFLVSTHCFLHREHYDENCSGEQLEQVLKMTIAIMNYVKTRPIKLRTF